jgi:hypothetical protein
MAQRRLAKDEEEEEGNREEEQAGTDRKERREDADDQPGHGQYEGSHGGQVHELVLQVMTGKNLPDPVLKADPPARVARIGGSSGSRSLIRLGLAAEPAEARIVLDLLAALTTEHPGAPFRRQAAAVFAANYTGVPGAHQPNSIRPVTKYAWAPLQAVRDSEKLCNARYQLSFIMSVAVSLQRLGRFRQNQED